MLARQNPPPQPGLRVDVGETVILLHPPLPFAGVSIGLQKGRQQNDGYLRARGYGSSDLSLHGQHQRARDEPAHEEVALLLELRS